MVFGFLLVFVPVSLALKYFMAAPALWVFASAAVAIAGLAEWVRRSTEQLAERAGPEIGGLLNISFGNIAELTLALFVLVSGKPDIVRAQITGSIMGTSLLGLGLAILVGGLTRERQTFRRENAGRFASLLVLATLALLLPALFSFAREASGHHADMALTNEELSLGTSAVLILLYAGNLLYTLVTHRDVFASEEAHGEPSWSLWLSLGVLVGGTAVIAIEAELVSDALIETAAQLGLSPLFLSVIVLALIGTAADLFAAVYFGHQDRMGLVMSICIGSAIQIALVMAPLLVLISWLIGHPMDLVFTNPLDLFAIAGTAWIVNSIAGDGETTWFEGVMLIGVYALLGLGFFFFAG
jgi:Ca2+:H+ antiporter